MKRKLTVISSAVFSLLFPIISLASEEAAEIKESPKSVTDILSDTLLAILKNNWAFILIFIVLLFIYIKRKHNEDPRNRDDE